jgi:hypothetical protein
MAARVTAAKHKADHRFIGWIAREFTVNSPFAHRTLTERRSYCSNIIHLRKEHQ